MHRQIFFRSLKLLRRRRNETCVNFCSTNTEPIKEIHEDDPNYSAGPIYPEETTNIFDENLRTASRLNEEYLKTWLPHERKVLAKIAKNLGTAKEKIDFVNPYERKWQRWEHHRHRLFHKPLTSPRKSFYLTPVPNGYNSLNLYKYVTQTHCIKGSPDIYDKIDVKPSQIANFRDRLIDILTLEKRGRKNFSEINDFAIDQIVNICFSLFSNEFGHIRDAQVGTNVRFESFVERGGYGELYYKFKTQQELDEEKYAQKKKAMEKKKAEEEKLKKDEKVSKNDEKSKETTEKLIDSVEISIRKTKKLRSRLLCDGFYRIGELSFCFRDIANAQFRSTLPLPQFVDINDQICRTPVPPCIYSPMDFTVPTDENPLWMVPGHEIGDGHEFGLLMINSFKNLRSRMNYWDAEREEFEECLLSMAIGSCFSWLSGQAHYLGFNHLNDVEYPLTTQAVITDCQDWYFASYQMNTLDMKTKFDGNSEQKCNICWFDGPFKLFDLDENGNFTNIDEKILEKFLKFLFLKPSPRENISELKPYIAKPVEKEITKQEQLEAAFEKMPDIVYNLPK